MNRRSLNICGAAVSLLAVAFSSQLRAQALQPVPAARVRTLTSKLDRTLLPPHSSSLQVETAQVVQLSTTPATTLVPVRFQVETSETSLVAGMPAPTHFACGVMVLRDGVRQQFVPSMGLPGSEREAEECTGLRAIGVARPDQPASGLILIYRVYVLHAPPADNHDEAVLLSWLDAGGTLAVDEQRTDALAHHLANAPTVPSVRRFLAHQNATDKH